MQHIDYGFDTIESINNIGLLKKFHLNIENQLYYVALVNIIPAINSGWSKLDLANASKFFSKDNNLQTLQISPKYKLENILLTTSVVTGDEKTYSLIEYLISWNIGRTNETYSRDFINYLSSYISIHYTARASLLHSSSTSAERANQYIAKRKKLLNKKNDGGNVERKRDSLVTAKQPMKIFTLSATNNSNGGDC